MPCRTTTACPATRRRKFSTCDDPDSDDDDDGYADGYADANDNEAGGGDYGDTEKRFL